MLNKLLENWSYLVYMLTLFPFLPRGGQSVLMGILFIVFLIAIFKNKPQKLFNQQERSVLLALAALPLLFLISTIYSDNKKNALDLIVRVLPLIILPLSILGLSKIYRGVNLKKFSIVYIFGVFLNTVFNQFRIFFSNKEGLTNWEYRQFFEELSGVHGTYYSLWISLAVLMATFTIIDNLKISKFKNAILFFLILVYLLYYQTILGARMPFIAGVLLLVIYLLSLLKRSKLLYLIGVIFVGLLVLIFVKTKSNLYHRIGELSHYNFELPEGDYHIKQGKITNTQIRNGVYFCSFSIVKNNLLFGTGIGDVQDELQRCYHDEIDSNVYDVFTFNTHNQYLLVLASNGILGLIIFLVSLIYLFKIARENKLYLYFFLVILLCFLTENILSRHDGVVFYALFSSVLILNCFNEKSFST